MAFPPWDNYPVRFWYSYYIGEPSKKSIVSFGVFLMLSLICTGYSVTIPSFTIRDQRMMFAVVTLVHTADTKEQLDADTDTLLIIARKHLCQFDTLKYQQMDGLNSALPIGHRKINALSGHWRQKALLNISNEQMRYITNVDAGWLSMEVPLYRLSISFRKIQGCISWWRQSQGEDHANRSRM